MACTRSERRVGEAIGSAGSVRLRVSDFASTTSCSAYDAESDERTTASSHARSASTHSRRQATHTSGCGQ
jgi:hypothetical protein